MAAKLVHISEKQEIMMIATFDHYTIAPCPCWEFDRRGDEIVETALWMRSSLTDLRRSIQGCPGCFTGHVGMDTETLDVESRVVANLEDTGSTSSQRDSESVDDNLPQFLRKPSNR